MRVLFLSSWFPYPPDNGSKIRAYYLISALARSHQVTVVAFCPSSGLVSQAPVLHIPNVQVYPVNADPYRYVGMPDMLKFVSPIPLMYWPSRSMQQTVTQVVGSACWDVAVVFQALAGRYALQLPGVPRILDVDTALSYQMYERHIHQRDSGRWRTWVSWQKAQQYETRLFRQFQACTVASSVELEHVTAMLRGANCRMEIAPNGVDCECNKLGLAQPKANTLIFNGALTYSANYDAMRYFLAEIYPLVRRQVPDVSLTITGSTSSVDLTGLNLDSSVHLSGYVEDIRPWVSGAAVCVTPLHQGGGTRLKILEAMALGTPVVSTTKGAEGLDVIDGEHILLADSPQSFADRTLQILRDLELRQRLTANARCLVERRYDWSHIGRRFVTLVEDVSAGRGSGGRLR